MKIWRWSRGSGAPLLLCFRSPVCCWRRCKKKRKGCATHTAGMSCMQSIESVSSGRQRGEEEEEKRSPLWKRQGARGGVYYDYYFMKKMKHKTHFLTPPPPPPPKKNPSINLFFFCFWWEIINDDPSRVVWSLADERRGEMWRERET